MPRNWDEHYAQPENLDFTPAPLIVQVADLLPPGDALDVACGAGRNALYLAGLGWRVTAVDASAVAISRLRERAAATPVDARVANLEAGEFTIAARAYDLICDFFYLQRDLFPGMRAGLREGGVFAGAIHLKDASGRHNPAFALEPGELREEFAGWKILFYSEAPEGNSLRPAARILARKA